jgi:DNA-binding beta-propeller fold protein YncE
VDSASHQAETRITPVNNPLARHLLRYAALLVFCAISAQLVFAAKPASGSAYSVVERWTLAGVGGWDCLTADPARHRLFLSRGDRVEVVDTDNGKLIGTIAGTAGVHAIALAPGLKRGFTSNGRTNTITVFDYDTLATIQEVPVPGENPDLMLYQPANHHLFVLNGRSHDAVILDARSLAVLAKVALPGKPEFAADDGHGKIYINIESEPGRLVRLDAAKFAVTANWELPGCNGPTGLALDVAHRRLFSACDDGVLAITDAATGAPVAHAQIGKGPDGLAFDAARGLILVSAGDGVLNVIHEDAPDRYSAVGAPATQAGARTLAFEAESRRVYTVTAKFTPPAAPTAEVPRPRPQPVPDSFTVLVLAPN